jgi:hypothetical protein
MVAEHAGDKRAIGHRRGDAAGLPQPAQSQLAHAREIGAHELRPPHDVGQQIEPCRQMARQGLERYHRDVGRRLHVEMGADARQRVSQANRVVPAGALDGQ